MENFQFRLASGYQLYTVNDRMISAQKVPRVWNATRQLGRLRNVKVTQNICQPNLAIST
jgi:hypothetical protein